MAKATLTEIRKALEKATGVTRAKGEDEQSYLVRIIRKTAALDEDEWDKLDTAAQNWYNNAAEVMNAKKPIPALFEEEAEDEPAPARKTARAKPAAEEVADDEPADPEVGQTVIITLDDGEKHQGVVTEISSKTVVIDEDGEEEIYKRSKIKAIKVKGAKAAPADDEPATKAEPAVGDMVEVTDADGEIMKGKLLEATERVVTIEVDGEEELIKRSKIKSIKVVGGAAPKAKAKADDEPEKKPASRASKAKDDEPSDKAKPATVRVREIMCENPDLTKEQVQKVLDKEGVEIKGSTLDITFSEVTRTFTLLRHYKNLK